MQLDARNLCGRSRQEDAIVLDPAQTREVDEPLGPSGELGFGEEIFPHRALPPEVLHDQLGLKHHRGEVSHRVVNLHLLRQARHLGPRDVGDLGSLVAKLARSQVMELA